MSTLLYPATETKKPRHFGQGLEFFNPKRARRQDGIYNDRLIIYMQAFSVANAKNMDQRVLIANAVMNPKNAGILALTQHTTCPAVFGGECWHIVESRNLRLARFR